MRRSPPRSSTVPEPRVPAGAQPDARRPRPPAFLWECASGLEGAAAADHRPLIGIHAVSNQPQLVELLAPEGISATQATVSRDLDDLGAVKVRVPGGDTVYAIPEYEPARLAPHDQLRRVMGEWVAEVRRPATSSSCAPHRAAPTSSPPRSTALVCAGLLGTVAGDDTLLCVAEERIGGPALADRCASWPASPGESHGTGRASATAEEWQMTGDDVDAGEVTHTLWHGRFAGRPGGGADGLHRQPAVRPAPLALTTSPARGPTSRGLAHAGMLTEDERDQIAAALDQVAARAGGGDVRVRRQRRGHPHRRRAAGHRSSPVRPAPSCTPGAAATTRWPPTCACGARRELRQIARRVVEPAGGAAAPRRGRRRRRGRLPPRLHPPAARPAGAAGPPPAGPRLGAGPRCRSAAGDHRPPRRLAARRRRPGRLVAAARPGVHRRRRSASPAPSTTASTRSATATTSPRRCSTSR